MTNLTRVGISLFALAVILGPVYTVDGYSSVSNVISELGAQHTQNSFIMTIAFMVLGAAISVDGLMRFERQLLPFILFGLLMGVVGLFPHKPLDRTLAFSVMLHQLHGIIAGLAGLSVTVGFIWRSLLSEKRHRIVCFYMAGVSTVFPVLMLLFPATQGIIQRLMYLQVLGWLWVWYPNGSVSRSAKS